MASATDTPPGFLTPAELAHAGSPPAASGTLRARPEDFLVEEELGYPLTGDGQHVWLEIEKRLLDTEGVATRLAQIAGVRRGDVGYAGLKDRRAVTRQWFSVDLAGRPEPDWGRALPEGCRLLEATRSRRKLRRGGHRGNRFRIVVSELRGETGDPERRLTTLDLGGVPNYFGPQRFGIAGANVARAWEMLHGHRRVRQRFLRSLYLSTARSLLFNRVLAHRVALGCWDRPVDGDLMMLDGSASVFETGAVDEALRVRAEELDIHPTGPLWGRGESRCQADAALLEHEALEGCEEWCAAVERAGLVHARRALRVRVERLEWRWRGPEALEIAFSLPAGSYATAVLREIVNV